MFVVFSTSYPKKFTQFIVKLIRYNKALTYNLVNSLQPIKQNDKDLNPELLLFPIDYSSPSDILLVSYFYLSSL